MDFKSKADHLRMEIEELFDKKGVTVSTDELQFIEDIVESMKLLYDDETRDLEDKVTDLKDERSGLEDKVEELENKIDSLNHAEVDCNGIIRIPEPENLMDSMIMDALILCLRAGNPNALLAHLEAFATNHNTINLIP